MIQFYLLSIALIALEWLLSPWLAPGTAACAMFAAVAASTWFGGVKPGLATVSLGLFSLLLPLNGGLRAHAFAAGTASGAAAFAIGGLILVEIVGRRRRAERSRREIEHWYRLRDETSRDGVCVVDLEGRTIFVNRRLARILGFAPRDMIGRPFVAFAVKRDRPRVERALEMRRETPNEGVDVRFRHGDGSKIFTSLSARPIRDERGETIAGLVVVLDIGESRRLESERLKALVDLARGEMRYRRLTESNIIGIIHADLGGNVLEANDAFLRMVGHGRVDIVADRARWIDMTPPEYRELDQDGIRQLWVSGVCDPYEKEFIRKDGSRVPVLVGAAALERYPREWIGFVVDLTRTKTAEHKLATALESAEAAGRAKDRFLAVLSHELRTPLTPVLAAVSAALDDSDLTDDTREILELTLRNVELEARLIDDLLDVTRISRGKLQLNKEVVDLHSLICRTVEICRDEAREGRVELAVESSAIEHHVEADPARLQQLLWNLVKNAVKFTPPDGRVAITTHNLSQKEISLQVSDTGIGIEHEQLTKIFDAFEQGEAGTTRRFGGLGLGLSISRAIAQALGGTLDAESEGKGKGATFTLRLAAVPPPSTETPAVLAGQNGLSSRRSLKILLVEDDVDTLRVMSKLLSKRGHRVSSAGNVASGLALSAAESFDLLVSDISLPDGSGLDLMRALSVDRCMKGIALSGFGMDGDLQNSRDAGFDAHITKPVNFQKLDALIQEIAAEIEEAVGL